MFVKTPKQVAAVDLMGKNGTVLLEGGARSGKTRIILRSQCIRRLRYPGTDGLAARLRLSHCRSSLWNQTLPAVLKDLGIQDRVQLVKTPDLCVTFPHPEGDSRLFFDGLDDQERVDKILGREYADVFLNEISQVGFSAYETVVTRLNAKKGVPLRFWMDQNPGSIQHWAYKIFHNRKFPDGRPVPKDDFACLKMNPSDNAANLSEAFFANLNNLSISKRLRFRDGEYGTEEGALWDRQWFRYGQAPVTLLRVVVGVDPSGSAGGDEVGIIVAGIDEEGTIWILADYSLQGSPKEWRDEVISAYDTYQADAIVAEKNFGGEMVEAVITDMGRANVNVILVSASRGKAVRAEPISALYEKNVPPKGHDGEWRAKVVHVKEFPALEDELCTWKPMVDTESPNRLDALVWAATELLEGGGNGDWVG